MTSSSLSLTLKAEPPSQTPLQSTAYTTINRRGQRLAILVDGEENTGGLVFLQHGSPGYKEQVQLIAMTYVFLSRGYTVVRFDTSNSFGNSDGELINANVTTHYHDLIDVVEWTKKQSWYQAPFILVGHSMGGITSLLYTIDHPEKVKALAPLSTALSFDHWYRAMRLYKPHVLQEFDTKGWSEKVSDRDLNRRGRWTFSYGLEYKKYDVPARLSEITVPVLLIVGEHDKVTPLSQQKVVEKGVSGPRELHIIRNAPHTFRSEENLEILSEIFEQWVAKL